MRSAQMVTLLMQELIAQDTLQMDIQVGAGRREEFMPGRFVHIMIPGRPDLILRRPISIYRYADDTGTLSLIYQIRGEGTRALAEQRPSTAIDMLGPLGNGFDLTACSSVLLIGGGIGCAPLMMIPYYDTRLSVDAIFGFRNAAYAYGWQEQAGYRSLDLMSDDGSIGQRGLVTDRLAELLWAGRQPDVILACGPAPMFRALQTVLQDRGIPCQISLEERMGCGMGACVTCACLIERDGERHYRRVCADGPVFPISEVVL